MADFLLIHGACHGGWAWNLVGEELRRLGHRTFAPDLPCEDPAAGLEDYAGTAMTALPDDHSDLVVVAHSLGALTAPIVASRTPTRRMIMVCGVIGSPNSSLAELADLDADRDVPLEATDLEFNEARCFRFSESGAQRTLFHDCGAAQASDAIPRLRFQRSMWNEVARFDAWPETEIVSVLCREDRVVNPDWSRRVSAERLGVQPVEMNGGHSPWLSRPGELAGILASAL